MKIPMTTILGVGIIAITLSSLSIAIHNVAVWNDYKIKHHCVLSSDIHNKVYWMCDTGKKFDYNF